MQGGDISADFQPTLLVVWEGLLGLPPEKKHRKPRWKPGRNSAEAEIARYDMNSLLLAAIRHSHYPVEVVTFLGPQYITPIEKRLEERHALVRRVWYTSPEILARIHLEGWVAAIYDPDPRRATLTYGTLGRHLLPANAQQFGAR